MQKKTLLNQANSTSNIHSSEFGSVSYDIFGSPYQKSGSFLANDSLNFGYLGKPYNADTKLYDYGFRDYSPEIARFTTVDPIRDGRNWYCYVVNDPVNYVDLWGLCGSDVPLAEVRFGVATPLGETYDDLYKELESIVTSEWGDRESFETKTGNTSPGHNGMDFAAPKGTRVNSVMEGEVVYLENQDSPYGYGNYVIVKHSNGTSTLYAHLDSIDVEVGQTLEAGQKLGEVGDTGLSTNPHLHFAFDGNKDGKFDKKDKQDDPARLLFSGGF